MLELGLSTLSGKIPLDIFLFRYINIKLKLKLNLNLNNRLKLILKNNDKLVMINL